jgi:hypothetical protein
MSPASTKLIAASVSGWLNDPVSLICPASCREKFCM